MCFVLYVTVDSDLDVASAEILRLTEENEQLRMANSEISNRLSSSVKENMEMSRLNSVTMELVNNINVHDFHFVIDSY